MVVHFTTNAKPKSYNADPKFKRWYQQNLANEYKALNPVTIPISNTKLYANILVIHRNAKILGDVDNFSKPIVDSFRGVIYADDDLIWHRIITKIETKDFSMTKVAMTDMTQNNYINFCQCLSNVSSGLKDSMTYLEIGEYEDRMLKVGKL